MKRTERIVNTARAAPVDSAALLDASRAETGGAAMDVFDVEPPAYNDLLVQMENVLCTPYRRQYQTVSIHRLITQNIERLLKGELS